MIQTNAKMYANNIESKMEKTHFQLSVTTGGKRRIEIEEGMSRRFNRINSKLLRHD